MSTKRTPSPHDMIRDEVLFERYCQGDIKAFEILVQRFKNLLYSLILRYTPNSAQAEEVFQDVFFKVCKNKDQFRESVSFKSWLMTICRNTCIDATRKKQRTPLSVSFDGDGPDSSDHAPSERLASDDIAPDGAMQWKLEDKMLTALLDELPEEQRATFYMKVVSEMTFEEIGTSMGVSTNTAKSRFRYAAQALRALVKRQVVTGKPPVSLRTV